MNRLMLLVAALALAPAAWGQLYKYTDKDGKTVYTDQPPGNTDSKQLRAPPAPPAAPPKPAADKKETAKAAPRAASDAGKKPEMDCQAARENYANFLDGPVVMRNTKTGERVELDEKGIEAEKAKAKTAMDAACKTPG